MMFACTFGTSAITPTVKFEITGTYVTKSTAEESAGNIASVLLIDENGRFYKAEVNESGNIGTYTADVPEGLYDITISKQGYLAYEITGVRISNRNVQIPELAVLPGDLDGDGIIGTKDLAVFIRGFNTDERYADIRRIADFDEDGTLNVTDLGYIKPNCDKSKENYEWTNIIKLQTDYRNDPLGIDFEAPEFNWTMESTKRGEKHTAYRIGVSSSYDNAVNGEYDVWDSGYVESSDTHTVYGQTSGEEASAPASLLPQTEYFWTVTCKNADGREIYASQIANFETALFGDFGDNNKWITLGESSEDAPYCELTDGIIELNLTCTNVAIGVWFLTSEDEKEKHMWYFQVNGTAYNGGKPCFKPHFNNNGGWNLENHIDLSGAGLEINKPFDAVIKISDEKITTTVNGVNAVTTAIKGTNRYIGRISERFAGSEAGRINYYTIKDANGNVVYTSKEEDESSKVAVSQATNTASVLFRKQFELEKDISQVAKARLYSTAAGNQIMYMNGKRASNDYMAPGKSQYTALLYYQTYDVTELILEGQNTVAAEVGQGWYNAGAVQANYGKNVGLRAKLIITFKDGTAQVIDTDSTWQSTNEGPTYLNRYYDGQKVDGRKHIDGWNDNDCSYDEWCNVIAKDTFITTNSYTLTDSFAAENMNPVRNTHTFNPTSVWELDDGSFIYRFDQNIVGTARNTAKAPRGTHITLYYAEALKNGNCVDRNTSTYLNHNGVDEYIFRGDEDGETVEFDLVYHGFQHIQIFGLDKALPLDQIEGLVLTSDMYETGRFESSNETLDRYMENIMWSIRGNFVSTLTDCPTREKNTWTGDAQLFAPTAAFFSDIFNHYRNFETMVSGSQYGDGGIPELVPSMVPHSEKSTGTVTKTPSGWADCIIFIPWEMYNQYGDVSIIKDNYEEMKKWIDFLMTKKIYFKGDTTKTLPYYINPETADYLRVDGNYGDHVAYYRGNKDIGYRENEYNTTSYNYHETSFSEIGTAVTAYSCKILGKMAQVIGEDEDAQYYAELSEKFAEAWRLNFVAEDGYTSLSGGKTTVTNVDGVDVYSYNPNVKRTYSGKEYDNIGSQTSYCMGLFFDLYETDEKKQKAAENLVKLLEYENYNMTVGYMGINYLFPVLSQAGYFDVALRTFENEKYPSILAMVKMGATSIWEDYAGSMSRNHYIYGTPGRWIYTDILGIGHNYKDGNAGFDHFELNPKYGTYEGTKLNYAKGSYDSVNGVIESEWHYSKEDGTFTYKCRVPANTSATLSLPIESENARITEGSTDISESEGVEYIKTEKGRRYYEITSGVYEFTVFNK